jgi:hypothetical protein
LRIKVSILLFSIISLAIFFNELESLSKTSKLLQSAQEYQDKKQYPDNTLVYITDKLYSQNNFFDDQYIEIPKETLILKKTVEMYSWSIRKHYKHSKEYEKKWLHYYYDTSNFFDYGIHQNPVPEQSLGIFYSYPLKVFFHDIEVSLKDFKFNQFKTLNQGNSYIYFGNSNLNNPQLGDIRIKYETFDNNTTVTIFAIIKNKLSINAEKQQVLDIPKNETFSLDEPLFHIFFKGTIENAQDFIIDNEQSTQYFIREILIFLYIFPIYLLVYDLFARFFSDKVLDYLSIVVWIITALLMFLIFPLVNILIRFL